MVQYHDILVNSDQKKETGYEGSILDFAVARLNLSVTPTCTSLRGGL